MALSTRLELRQGQQLVMTPQLQQAIRLLQLSNMELADYVEGELERNPLLEREEASEPEPSTQPEAAPAEAGDELLGPNDGDAASAYDTEYDNVYPDATPAETGAGMAGSASPTPSLGSSSHSGQRMSLGDDGEDASIEDWASRGVSLREHLSIQLNLAVGDPARRLIGQHLIDQVDEAGYVEADLTLIAGRLGTSLEEVEAVLATLQAFDPVGVCARSLGECLALQLKEQDRYDPMIAALISNLHLLAAHNLAALKRAVGADMDELADMIRELKRLNPKPGLQFGADPVQSVVPDVLVRPASDGGWIVELNSDTLPRVLVNRAYLGVVSGSTRNVKDREYINECLQNANWLVKSLDQRARTILRVAQEIVRQQDAFFVHGVQHLRPLNLKTVADAIGMHESTVSRVTSNKYMATSRGILELKYFFTSSIPSAGDGEAHSSEAVRHRIRHLVEAETAKSVLSDDRIVELLADEGIDIARRTVAKYRDAMRIPSSVQRRRHKQLAVQVEAVG